MQLKNHLLIATPSFNGTFFEQSVIYIFKSNINETAGIIINKPTDMSVGELCCRYNYMLASSQNLISDQVVAGGLEEIQHGYFLHTKTSKSFKRTIKLSDDLRLTTSPDLLKTLGTKSEPEDYLVALGCVNWNTEDLKKQISESYWLIVEADENILFTTPFNHRWREAAERLNVKIDNLSLITGRC